MFANYSVQLFKEMAESFFKNKTIYFHQIYVLVLTNALWVESHKLAGEVKYWEVG